jgi:hypothetical protein
VTAEKLIANNDFAQGKWIDEAVIIHSSSSAPTARTGRSSQTSGPRSRTPARPRPSGTCIHQSSQAISEDGHAAVITLVLGHDAETGIVKVLNEVSAANTAAGFNVAITGANTLDHESTSVESLVAASAGTRDDLEP